MIKKEDGTKKSSLVQGELADLEAKRGSKRGKNNRRGSGHRTNSCWDEMNYSLKIVRQNPHILLLSFCVFAILCGGGLALVFFLSKSQDDDDKGAALDLAVDTGRWFGKSRFSCVHFSMGCFPCTIVQTLYRHHTTKPLTQYLVLVRVCNNGS